MNSLSIINHYSESYYGFVNEWMTAYGIPLNIYAGVNPRKSIGGSKEEDVLLARNLWIDIDNITVDDSLERLRMTGFQRPTMIVDSGHGVHFYWRLDEPIHDLVQWTKIQKKLIRLFDSDKTIHDTPRIMRVPSFLNHNGSKPVMCKVFEISGIRYALDAILELLPSDVSEKTQISIDTNGTETNLAPPSERLTRAKRYVSKIKPYNELRNNSLFSLCLRLLERFRLSESETLELVVELNRMSEKPVSISEIKKILKNAYNLFKKKGRKTVYEEVATYLHDSHSIIELDQYRQEMVSNSLDSLSHHGIYLDRSTTGAGKSTADIVAMKEVGKSAVFLPTHAVCDEFTEELNRKGLNASSHPPLDETTCLIFGPKDNPGKARIAMNSGLNVGACICPKCPYSKDCDYQKKREVARNADHVVSTHTRASLSDFQPALDKPVAFIHEDVLNLLRPVVKVVKESNKESDPQLKHFDTIILIADSAKEIAEIESQTELINFATNLKKSAEELRELIINKDLIDVFDDAVVNNRTTQSLPRVMNIPRKKNIKKVNGIDILLNRAMDKICRRSNGQVLRLCIAYTFGELCELCELCAVVDELKQNGRDQHFTKSLIGVWNVILPKEMVVWVENASTSVELMTDLVGKEVQDKTPQGSLEYKVAPIQYATTDITKNTSPNVIRSVIRGLLVKYSDAKNVGIITQQVHVKSIKELDSFWVKRIKKIEYYFSGKDRASNSWLDCDLILVLGTPRVPPSAIRELLIRLGKIDSAAIQDKFVSHIWQGLRVDGSPTNIECVGYCHKDWIMCYNLLVRETLRQAIGRGRGVCDHGVPVLVVSNENLGCDLAAESLIELSDQVEGTYRTAHSLIIEKGETDTKMIAEKCKMSVRTTTDHLNTIVSLGLLERKSQRGAWILPPITKQPKGVDKGDTKS